MNIRPIRSDEDHKAALVEIEKLWGADVASPEGDRLDVLATLVDAYEEKRWPIAASDPVEVLTEAVRQRSQAELAEILGSRSRASEILRRRRPLTLPMVERISSAWKIPADLLVKSYRLDGPREDGRTDGDGVV